MSPRSKVFWLIAGLIIIYIVVQYLRTRHYLQLGLMIADQAIAYEQHPTSPTARILVIGDSTTVGTGATTPQDSTAGLLGHDFPTADIMNQGVNGARVADLTTRFAEFSDDEFDLVLVQIGGNDIVRFTNYQQLEKDLHTVLAEAQRVGKQVVLLHCGDFGTARLLPVGTRWLITHRTKQLRAIYLRLAPQYEVRYVDLLRPRDRDPFANDPATYYAADQFHPSSTGYADWYEHIKPIVQAGL
jgi:lysophospholipase L1-like esterase